MTLCSVLCHRCNVKGKLAFAYLGFSWCDMENFRPTFHIPVKLALLVISLLKRVGDKLNGGESSLVLSAATVHTLSCSRTFDCSKAKNQFGYSSTVSFQVIPWLILCSCIIFYCVFSVFNYIEPKLIAFYLWKMEIWQNLQWICCIILLN